MTGKARALVVADSDSYLKWGARRAVELADRYETDVVVVRSATTPSAQQVADALAGTHWHASETSAAALVDALVADPPEVLFLACRGPIVEFILRRVRTKAVRQPVVATGIPGLWFPPTSLGLRLRRLADLLVVHSRAERNAVRKRNYRQTFLKSYGLASIMNRSARDLAHPEGPVVFAPQAVVPRTEPERVELLRGIVRAARANPDVPFIIKVRGMAGEAQTHPERMAYEDLATRHSIALPPNVSVERGPLSDFLDGARGFFTVSSTAALEAVGAGVPTLCLHDFGISKLNINQVFKGSGLLGSLDDLADLRFKQPREAWMRDNYFHDVADDNWLDLLDGLVENAPERDLADVPSWRGVRRWPQNLLTRANALGNEDVFAMRVTYRVAGPPVRKTLEAGRRAKKRLRGSTSLGVPRAS